MSKRFINTSNNNFVIPIWDLKKECSYDLFEIIEYLNTLHEENQQIKDLIHTMLEQIDIENITSDSAIYSARINFSRNEFNLIRELWKGS